MSKYTKEQIAKLGIRPREGARYSKRRYDLYDLLPCEKREVKAVVKAILDTRDDDLWQQWRLIPFEEGYACQRMEDFKAWVYDQVESMWNDIGHPVFEEDGTWSCPEGGWWPYLDKEYIDICWIKVGKAIINIDEVDSALKQLLQEKVRGYRMCPGMALYRVVWELVRLDHRMKNYKGSDLGDKMEKTRAKLYKKMIDLTRDYPTDTSIETPDHEWYPFS